MLRNRFSYSNYLVRRRRRRSWTVFLVLAILAGSLSYYLSWHLPDELGEALPNAKPRVGGKIISLQHIASLTGAQVDAEARAVYAQPDLPPARSGVEQYLVTYSSEDPRNGREVHIKARYYLPLTGQNLPVFAFGPGTSGPGMECAPSLERARGKNWGRYDNHMLFYAGQGYATAITDYDGRLTPEGISHYFIGETEGRAMLDMVIALRALQDNRFKVSPASTDVFFAGYSQGGHAALWADQLASIYAPELRVRGVIGFAAATDLFKMFYDTANLGMRATWIPPYVYAAYDDYYDLSLPPTAFFQPPIAATLASDTRTLCIDQVEVNNGRYGTPQSIASIYQPDFLASLRERTLESRYPEWGQLLKKNLAGDVDTPRPKLILGGKRDAVIHESAQVELARRLCRHAGAVVKVELYPEVTHYTVMTTGRASALAWMAKVRGGQTPGSECHGYRL